MSTWFSSDPHYGHSNIIVYTGRPHADADEMDADLVERWNALVAPTDEAYILGDIALGKGMPTLPLIGLLNGRKTLVPGNHDKCWLGNRKGAREARALYLDAGFDEIVDDPDPIWLADRYVRMSHFPYRGDSRELERHMEHRPRDHGDWLIHGHVHEKWRQRGRQINVGVDAWGGRPVHEDEIVELIHAGLNDLAPLPWHR